MAKTIGLAFAGVAFIAYLYMKMIEGGVTVDFIFV